MLPCAGRWSCHHRAMQVKFWTPKDLFYIYLECDLAVIVYAIDFQFIIFLALTRPLSKTVRFNVLKVIPAGSAAGGKKSFTGMWGWTSIFCLCWCYSHIGFRVIFYVRGNSWSFERHSLTANGQWHPFPPPSFSCYQLNDDCRRYHW